MLGYILFFRLTGHIGAANRAPGGPGPTEIMLKFNP